MTTHPTVRAALEQVTASTANVSVAKAASLPRFDSVWQTNGATANNVFGQKKIAVNRSCSILGPVLAVSVRSRSVWGSAVGGLFLLGAGSTSVFAVPR